MSVEIENPTTNHSWISNQLFAKVLEKHQESGRDVIVHELDIEPAVGKGENYTSSMMRVAIKYSVGDEEEQ